MNTIKRLEFIGLSAILALFTCISVAADPTCGLECPPPVSVSEPGTFGLILLSLGALILLRRRANKKD